MNYSVSIVLLSFALSACGGGSGQTNLNAGATPPPTVQPLTATSQADTLLSVLDGRLLTATSVTLRRVPENGLLRPVQVDTAYGYDPSKNLLTVKVGNTTRTLNLSGADPNTLIENHFVSLDNGIYTVFWVPAGGSLDEYLNGIAAAEFAVPIVSFAEEDSQLFTDLSYGIAGLETPATFFQAAAAQASYSGSFMLDNISAVHFDTDPVRFYGDLSLNVDFASMSVSGGIMTLADQVTPDGTSVSRAGSIMVGSSAIDGNGNTFQSTLQANAPGITLRSDAAMKGGFYGNTAQEVGGTISYSGTLDGNDTITRGVYIALAN